MKTYVLKDANPSSPSKDFFHTGLVFGFDVGTGSIGYAVREGSEFKDVGVLICDSEGSDLSKRRDLRRQRRTLRSKKFRRQWFDKELVKLGLPKPENPPNDPIVLRLRALNGEELKPEELHAALTHEVPPVSIQTARLQQSAVGECGKGSKGIRQAEKR